MVSKNLGILTKKLGQTLAAWPLALPLAGPKEAKRVSPIYKIYGERLARDGISSGRGDSTTPYALCGSGSRFPEEQKARFPRRVL